VVAAHRADGQLAVDRHAVAALRAVELAFDVLARGDESNEIRGRVLRVRSFNVMHQCDPLCVTPIVTSSRHCAHTLLGGDKRPRSRPRAPSGPAPPPGAGRAPDLALGADPPPLDADGL